MTSLKKILVVGSGGREHALALRLLESASVGEVVVVPGNPGTRSTPARLVPKVLRNAPGAPLEVARAERVDLVVVGPEVPLAEGLVDALAEHGIPAFGPTRAAARLESSKAFMKEFARRHGIHTSPYVTVHGESELDAALARFADAPVVKADGLCAGKGVVVADSHEQARAAAREMLSGRSFGDAGKKLVLEERVAGFELSVHAISDGERFVVLPYSQDHKRIGDGDTGPNTGGMGAYAPAVLVDAERGRWIAERVIGRAISGMAEDGHPFRGTLYAGLMVPEAGDPVVIEFNVRFGDPEAQVLVNVLDGDFAAALLGAAQGALDPKSLSVSSGASLCVVLAAGGYPGAPATGEVIDGVERAGEREGVVVYQAGTRLAGESLVTAGGRVLGVTGNGASLDDARARAYAAVREIRFAGMQVRKDIGARAAR
jgi:phosphoribosylamine--glycine ligase